MPAMHVAGPLLPRVSAVVSLSVTASHDVTPKRKERKERERAAAVIANVLFEQHWLRLRKLDESKWRPRLVKELVQIDSAQLWALCRGAHPKGTLALTHKNQPVVVARSYLERFKELDADNHRMAIRADVNQQGLCMLGEDGLDGYIVEPFATLYDHAVIVGATKTGKTAHMADLVGQYVNHGPAVVLDAHGDLAGKIVPFLTPKQRERTIIIDVGRDGPTWGINLLQTPRVLGGNRATRGDGNSSLRDEIADHAIHQMVSLEADKSGFDVGSRAQSQIRNIAGMAAQRPNASYMDAYFIETDPRVRAAALAECTYPPILSYFQEFFTKNRAEFNDPARNKLEVMTRHPFVETFCRRDACMPLADMMRTYDLIIFNLDQGRLPRNVVNNLGSLLLGHVLATLDRRPMPMAGPRGRVGIFVDEFGSYPSAVAANFLAGARKRGAFLALGFQHLDQLTPEVQASLGNAANWTIFRCSESDAQRLARQFGIVDPVGKPDVARLCSLPAFLACHVSPHSAGRDGATDLWVNLRTWPPPIARFNVPKELERIAVASMVKVGKPFNPSNLESVFRDDGATEPSALLGLHALQCEGAVGTPANLAKIASILGRVMPSADLPRLLEAMRSRGLVAVGNGGVMQLTAAGLAKARDLLDPGVNAAEGGPLHRDGVVEVYCALQRAGLARVEVPQQQGRAPRPDLLLPTQPDDAASWAKMTAAAGPVWFQFESSTLTKLTKVASNITNASKAGARAIVIIRLPDDAARHASLLERVAKDVEAVVDAKAAATGPITVWGLTAGGRLVRRDGAVVVDALI